MRRKTSFPKTPMGSHENPYLFSPKPIGVFYFTILFYFKTLLLTLQPKAATKHLSIMKDEKIKDGTFKEGLCYVKNYDGTFNGDPTDPCSAMEPGVVL